MSPVQNRLAPGQEPFAIFVATGEAGVGDLFAVKAEGGATFPITYTRVDESAPALSPNGTEVAFIREGVRGDSASRRVVVMNLLNGAERTVTLPDGVPDSVAWSPDAALLYIRTGSSMYVAGAPPAEANPRRLDRAGFIHADSAFAVYVGMPAFGQVVNCPGGGLCVSLPDGTSSLFSADGRGAVRWGKDSVGYFVDASFFVRPLGPGRMRELRLTPPRPDPRQLTYFPGPPDSTQAPQ
jgi:hypothetical protein